MDEQTKQRLLEELAKEYNVILKPKKETAFSVKDILDEYMPKICEKIHVENHWRNTDSIGNSIRKAVCLRFGVASLREVPVNQRDYFRKVLKDFIEDFILKV